MKYILFANNNRLSSKTLEAIPSIETDDILVFFNRLVILDKFPELKNYQSQKYAMTRHRNNINLSNHEVYAGLDKIMKIQHLFNKIFIYRLPHTLYNQELADKCSACLSYYNLDPRKIDSMDKKEMNRLHAKYDVRINKPLSSGLIMYLHLLENKKASDTIYLVGFNSGISSHHDPTNEKEFFQRQLGLNNYVQIM
jgi:hypothetical protein